MPRTLAIDLVPVDPYSVGDFNSCIELENPTPYTEIPFIDVREEWQTSCATVEMRLAGSSNILRRVERLELDQCQWPAVGRSFTNAEAAQLTEPFPLMCHSFQISQPGEEYSNYMPATFDMGQRGSTLRTFADFNLQATRYAQTDHQLQPATLFHGMDQQRVLAAPCPAASGHGSRWRDGEHLHPQPRHHLLSTGAAPPSSAAPKPSSSPSRPRSPRSPNSSTPTSPAMTSSPRSATNPATPSATPTPPPSSNASPSPKPAPTIKSSARPTQPPPI